MYFKVSWDEDFDTLMMHLWGKYGKEMFTMDGIGEQMDMNKFSQDFFNKGHSPTTDVSVDGNANVTQRTSIEYNHELPKPMRRYNSYFLLWKQLKKDVGLEFANRIIEAQLNGDIYINDFTDIALPYSYHPGTTFIVKSGDVIQKVTMESLFSLYGEYTQYLNDREQIDLRYAKLQVLDIKDGKPFWTDLKYILRHNSHTNLKHVVVANGSSFTVTTDHPCILDDWSEKKADELSIGDRIMGMDYDATFDFIRNSGTAHVDYTSGGVDSDYNKYYDSMPTITVGDDNSVIGVTDVPYIGEWVYDITTESGHFYSNGSIVHNCFNYSTYDIALEGLVGVSERPIVKAPKSLDTFIRQVEQFMVIAANSTLGATGFADILIVASHFVRKIMETGYDGHVYIGTDIERVKTYVKEKFTEFIYTVNWSFRGNQSPFSNLSVFDNTFLNSLCPDYVLFERPADPEIVKMIQEIYIDAMNDELARTPLTFPVTTACFCTDKNGEIDDTEFMKVIAEKNLKYGFINIYCGKSSTLSSCCFNGEQKVHVLLHGSRSGQDMSFKELVKVTEGYPYLMAKYEGYWYPAKVIKLKYTGKMYHIILEGGRDMICTPDHIHVVYGGEKYSAELTMNDYIRVREKADGVDAYMVEKGEKVDKLYEKIKYIGVIEKNEDGYVYCLEMEDSTNPYFQLSNGVITHNCRLRSESDNPYMNSFGAGSTKIGSLGVVTVNFPRAAMNAVAEAEANHDPETKEQIFMERLRNLFDYECLINQAKREIVSKRIELGAAPLYTHGYMDLKKQYSTFGVVGLNEAVSILGYDILTEEGQDFVTRVLKTMNEWIKCAENQYKAPHNAEAVPAESSAVKLANKDKMLGYDCGVPFYSNQFIPLTVKANMLDRIRLQGKFDNLFSGGAICHVNVDTEITKPEQIEELIKYAAKKGVVYWAINYRLNYCKNKHGWVGSHKCPVCGGDAEETITRVVGFFTNVKNWNKTRREHDWPNRQFYKSIV